MTPPNTFLMFHNYSTTYEGKGGELVAQVEAVDKTLKKVEETYCLPFLTKNNFNRKLTVCQWQMIYFSYCLPLTFDRVMSFWA